MNDEGQSPADKPHEPTPRRLEEAREKGDIVRSADLNAAVVYGGFLLFGTLMAGWLFETLGRLTQVALARADPLAALILAPGGEAPARAVLAPAMLASGALMAAPALLLIAALLAQRGIVFAPDKLAPKLSRVSPVQNAKQKYGAEGLFQFAKAAAKLVIVSALLGGFLWARADAVLNSIHGTPGQILVLLGELTIEFMAVVLALGLAIGALDWLWERAQLTRRNRMSRQELQDEMKTTEGDPHMKRERRARAQEIAGNRMMSDVPGADVVVVNPSHYAVALKWSRRRGEVPVCVAKGVDAVAARIRAVASEAGVPVYSDPPAARALFATVEIGAPVAPDHYPAVAAAIRFADEMRRRAGRRRGRRKP